MRCWPSSAIPSGGDVFPSQAEDRLCRPSETVRTARPGARTTQGTDPQRPTPAKLSCCWLSLPPHRGRPPPPVHQIGLTPHAFHQRQQRGAIQLPFHPLHPPAHSKLTALQTLAPYPISARLEPQYLHHRAAPVEKHEPVSTRRLFTQVPPHSGRQSIKRTPHLRRLSAQPDASSRYGAPHHSALHTRSTTPAPSSSSTSHDGAPLSVSGAPDSSANTASGASSLTAGAPRSLRRHRSNGLNANPCAAQNLPRL